MVAAPLPAFAERRARVFAALGAAFGAAFAAAAAWVDLRALWVSTRCCDFERCSVWGASSAAARATPLPAKAKLMTKAQDSLIQPASSQNQKVFPCDNPREAHFVLQKRFHMRDLAHIHRCGPKASQVNSTA